MPPREVAEPLARRLRELGFNHVRLHYFDWAAAPEGLMAADMRSLDPAKLEQLDFLFHQLKAHGIYVNLNLHVARSYPGLPKGWPAMGKVIDRIDPDLIEDQEEYARRLLTHRNPHTGLTYAEDPALVIVEINNENGLLQGHGGVSPAMFAGLPEEHLAPIRDRWNAWLAERYDDTVALRSAWIGADGGAAPAEGQELLTGGSWKLEGSGADLATLSRTAGEGGSSPMLRWEVKRPGDRAWDHQLHWDDHAAPRRDRGRGRRSR